MEERRIIGLDLGIASAHTARVLNGEGKVVAKRKAIPTTESLSALEAATALEGAPPGTVLEIVMEPTGPAWLPIAVFFTSRGHKVFRVPSAKAHDMRRYFSRHAKSNSIDADALAKLAIVDPEGLRPLELDRADEVIGEDPSKSSHGTFEVTRQGRGQNEATFPNHHFSPIRDRSQANRLTGDLL